MINVRWVILATVALLGACVSSVSLAKPIKSGSNLSDLRSACTAGTNVSTAKGTVCGITKAGVTYYEGIPYAAPPIGNLRWTSPKPHQSWTGVLRATKVAPGCVQPVGRNPPPMSENCLYLRVLTPAGQAHSGHRLPVVVEVHGGGFLDEFEVPGAARIVKRNRVIYVYMRYRVGVLGFLALPQLGPHAGDYGLQDQQAALRWVKNNIMKFGGDPNNVTVFGESAGGASGCILVASPAARGLFNRVFSISGFYNFNDNIIWWRADCKSQYRTEAEANKMSMDFAAKIGCNNTHHILACMRKIPAAKLVKEASNERNPNAGGVIGPTINGTSLPMSPAVAFNTGNINKVSVIFDVAGDEFNGGVYHNIPGHQIVVANTSTQYRELVKKQFGVHSGEVLKRYPLSKFPDSSPFIAYRRVMSDAFSVCPILDAGAELSKYTKTYVEINEDGDTPTRPGRRKLPLGAYHSATNRMLFFDSQDIGPNQRITQDLIVEMFGNFATYGTPTRNGSPVGNWQTFSVRDHRVMILHSSDNSRLIPASEVAAMHQCTFWNRKNIVTPKANALRRGGY